MSELHRPGIAVLSSGSGSTLEAFIHAAQARIVDADVGLVISNNSNAGVFKRVKRLNNQYGLDIKTVHISGATHPAGPGEQGEQTLQESDAIADEISGDSFSLVALMGYMKKIRGPLLYEYGYIPKKHTSIHEARMLNTHPGPLPYTRGFFGIHVQEKVFELGLGFSAQTLHLVAEGYDTGPILAEHRVLYIPGDTPESLFESVQLTEKTHLPVDINRFLHPKGDQ